MPDSLLYQTAAEMLHGIASNVPVKICKIAREHYWYNVENVGMGGYPETILENAGGLSSQLDLASAQALSQADEFWDPGTEAHGCFSFRAWCLESHIFRKHCLSVLCACSEHMCELDEKAQRATHMLMATVLAAPANRIAVVCHQGVISMLTGLQVQNCDCVVLEVTQGEPQDTWAVLGSTYVPRMTSHEAAVPQEDNGVASKA